MIAYIFLIITIIINIKLLSGSFDKKEIIEIQEIEDNEEEEEKISYIPSFDLDWCDFIGGGYAKKVLNRKARLFLEKNIMPEHFILSAKGGMGKTMLVKIFASKMGINFIEVPADQLKEDKDFFELMEKINDKTILFFEECQCLDKKILANHIYRLMEDNTYIRYNQIIELPEICIIGATTDIEKFEPSFSSRFKAKIEIDDYTHEEMGKIIESRVIIEMKKSEQIKIGIEIAKRSFGIPRIAIGHLKSIEEIAILEDEYLSIDLVNSYFEEIGLDENGLNKKHLGVIEFFKRNENKPMSIKRLSIAMGFNRQKVFESEIELPMSSLGLIDSTSRGRCLTEIGLKY